MGELNQSFAEAQVKLGKGHFIINGNTLLQFSQLNCNMGIVNRQSYKFISQAGP